MKNYYENLRALLKEPPQFQPNLLVIKCPEFIVNAFLGKYGDSASNQQQATSSSR